MAIPLRRRQSVMKFSIKLKELVFCDYREIISVDVQVMSVVKPVFLERLFAKIRMVSSCGTFNLHRALWHHTRRERHCHRFGGAKSLQQIGKHIISI